eukprot:1447683-Alexandrium_andersonii.AAC.1
MRPGPSPLSHSPLSHARWTAWPEERGPESTPRTTPSAETPAWQRRGSRPRLGLPPHRRPSLSQRSAGAPGACPAPSCARSGWRGRLGPQRAVVPL